MAHARPETAALRPKPPRGSAKSSLWAQPVGELNRFGIANITSDAHPSTGGNSGSLP
jgi:hypothetical protein